MRGTPTTLTLTSVVLMSYSNIVSGVRHWYRHVFLACGLPEASIRTSVYVRSNWLINNSIARFVANHCPWTMKAHLPGVRNKLNNTARALAQFLETYILGKLSRGYGCTVNATDLEKRSRRYCCPVNADCPESHQFRFCDIPLRGVPLSNVADLGSYFCSCLTCKRLPLTTPYSRRPSHSFHEPNNTRKPNHLI